LLSSKTICEDKTEIREVDTEPYVAGQIAVIHRKIAILKYFEQERDVLLNATDNEIGALEDVLLLAQPWSGRKVYARPTRCLRRQIKGTLYI
jgi:hypothetical protein